MKKSFTLFCCGTLALIVAAGCSKPKEAKKEANAETKAAPPPKPPEPPVDLKARWQVGKRYLFHTETVQTNVISMPNVPQPVQQEMNQSQDTSVNVVGNTPGGGQELDVTHVAMKMESRVGGRTLAAFDSASDPRGDRTNVLAGIQRRIVGKTYKVSTDANGQPQDIEGYDEFIKKVVAGGNRQTQTMLKGFLTKDNLKKAEVISNGLPGKSLKPGESFKIDTEFGLPGFGTFKVSETATFKGWEQRDGRKVALIEKTGVITSSTATNAPVAAPPAGTPAPTVSEPSQTPSPGAPAPAAPAAGVPGQVGTVNGKAWFDPDLGAIVEQATEQTANMSISGRAGANVSSQMHQMVTIKLVEVKDAGQADTPKAEAPKTEAPKAAAPQPDANKK